MKRLVTGADDNCTSENRHDFTGSSPNETMANFGGRYRTFVAVGVASVHADVVGRVEILAVNRISTSGSRFASGLVSHFPQVLEP